VDGVIYGFVRISSRGYGKLLVALVAAAVAIAFADSSIGAAPPGSTRFDDDRGRRLGGNRVQRRVAAALVLVLFVPDQRRARGGAGLVVFSERRSPAGSLPFLIGMRSAQGVERHCCSRLLPVLGR
jgi:hypothetical protein